MPLCKRVIPCLDIKDGYVVKGTNFVDLAYAGDPVKLAEKYRDDGADELVLLDISATPERRETLVDLIKKIGKVIDIPYSVGGGIRTVDDVRNILLAGADKVTINTSVVNNPNLLKEMVAECGGQSIVLSIDAKRQKDGTYVVYTHGGRTKTELDVFEWAKKGADLGVGEILLTSIDKDGTLDGYDLELTRAVYEKVNVPVIASGGCGSVRHMIEVLRKAADAALAASIFHYERNVIQDVKKTLSENTVNVKLGERRVPTKIHV